MRRPRWFDTRLIIVTTIAAMIFYLIYVGVASFQDTQSKSHRIDTLIAESSQARRAASHERDMLLENQDALLDHYAHLEAQQRALVKYLRAHGILVPDRFFPLSPSLTLPNPPPAKSRPSTPRDSAERRKSPAPRASQPGKSQKHANPNKGRANNNGKGNGANRTTTAPARDLSDLLERPITTWQIP